jgi:hypothetical protein
LRIRPPSLCGSAASALARHKPTALCAIETPRFPTVVSKVMGELPKYLLNRAAPTDAEEFIYV